MSVEHVFLLWLQVYRELAVAERAVREGAADQESRLRVLALRSRCARALDQLQAALARSRASDGVAPGWRPMPPAGEDGSRD